MRLTLVGLPTLAVNPVPSDVEIVPFRLLIVPAFDRFPSPTLDTVTVAAADVPVRARTEVVLVTAFTGATPVPVRVAVRLPVVTALPKPPEKVATAEPVVLSPRFAKGVVGAKVKVWLVVSPSASVLPPPVKPETVPMEPFRLLSVTPLLTTATALLPSPELVTVTCMPDVALFTST